MNKRLNELATLAEVWTIEDGQDKCEVDLELFARLILQVAMEVVRDEVAYHTDWDCADDVIKTVNEYFGI